MLSVEKFSVRCIKLLIVCHAGHVPASVFIKKMKFFLCFRVNCYM